MLVFRQSAGCPKPEYGQWRHSSGSKQWQRTGHIALPSISLGQELRGRERTTIGHRRVTCLLAFTGEDTPDPPVAISA